MGRPRQEAKNNTTKTVLVNINKKKPRYRPKQWWLDIVNGDIIDFRTEWNGDLNHVYDREEQKKLVLVVKGLYGL